MMVVTLINIIFIFILIGGGGQVSPTTSEDVDKTTTDDAGRSFPHSLEDRIGWIVDYFFTPECNDLKSRLGKSG